MASIRLPAPLEIISNIVQCIQGEHSSNGSTDGTLMALPRLSRRLSPHAL